MANKPAQSITKHFAFVTDPRTGNAKQHLLLDILVIAICATISGADTWVSKTSYIGLRRELSRTVLDIAFREDESRMRKLNSPENFAMVRHVAYILLKQEQSEKIGIKAKRLKAACDRDYLIKVLSI